MFRCVFILRDVSFSLRSYLSIFLFHISIWGYGNLGFNGSLPFLLWGFEFEDFDGMEFFEPMNLNNDFLVRIFI